MRICVLCDCLRLKHERACIDTGGRKRSGEGSECFLGLDRDMALCRRLVKAAEDESVCSPPTEALVVQSPVCFHLVSFPQGKFIKKNKKTLQHWKLSLCPHLDIFLSIKSPKSCAILSYMNLRVHERIITHMKLCTASALFSFLFVIYISGLF